MGQRMTTTTTTMTPVDEARGTSSLDEAAMRKRARRFVRGVQKA